MILAQLSLTLICCVYEEIAVILCIKIKIKDMEPQFTFQVIRIQGFDVVVYITIILLIISMFMET